MNIGGGGGDENKMGRDAYRLFTGGLACSFMENIGDGVDFALIDTMHNNPGEILDFLMVLPFLKENAIVAFHDVNLQTSMLPNRGYPYGSMTNNLLFSTISGERKFIQGNFDKQKAACFYPQISFPNIAAIQLNQSTRSNIFDVFNLLTLGWTYLPTADELNEIRNFISVYYEDNLTHFFDEATSYHTTKFEQKNNEAKTLIGKSFSRRILKHLLPPFVLELFRICRKRLS
jgi:hypothetical protein